MAERSLRERRDDQPAYVLHAYPYRETSLIVEALTREHGRVGVVARGAKRPRSEMRGLLQAFQPLLLGWAGTGELKTLIRAEWRGGLPLPSGAALLSAFYLNELILKLVPREDAHPGLFDAYEDALLALTRDTTPAAQGVVLRRFELRLLAELGYALALTLEADTGAPVVAQQRYHYAFDRGPQRHAAEPAARWPLVRGATLIALAEERYPDPETASEAKRLMRQVLDHYLEARAIVSRRIVQDLIALDDERDAT
jgi:DNA repair protein RecO (recombination protein O)